MEDNLMNHLKAFRDLLAREADHVSALVKLEEQKYESLKSVDMTSLMNVNTNEEETLQMLDSIEKRRKKAIAGLAAELKIPPDITLSDLIRAIPDEKYNNLKNELIVLRNRIKGLTEKLQVNMTENSELIRSNLDIINMTLSFANRGAQKETYGDRAASARKESRDSIYIINQIA